MEHRLRACPVLCAFSSLFAPLRETLDCSRKGAKRKPKAQRFGLFDSLSFEMISQFSIIGKINYES